MSNGIQFDPHREPPIIEEDDSVMTGLSCVGCGTRNKVKALLLKTGYQQGDSGRQVIPICELCSLNLGMQLFHIWNPGNGGSA